MLIPVVHTIINRVEDVGVAYDTGLYIICTDSEICTPGYRYRGTGESSTIDAAMHPGWET